MRAFAKYVSDSGQAIVTGPVDTASATGATSAVELRKLRALATTANDRRVADLSGGGTRMSKARSPKACRPV
jgi:hypothetical protein